MTDETRPHKNDDLWWALRYNDPKKFTTDEIVDIIAEVPGENDEFLWWWILELKNGKFALFGASCDYTGWDCQSGIDFEDVYNSAIEAANAAPIIEEYSNRSIRKNLVGQLEGQYPKFTYWGDA